jgi:hypothetical protein
LSEAWHEAIGLVMLVLAIGVTVRLMSPAPRRGVHP